MAAPSHFNAPDAIPQHVSCRCMWGACKEGRTYLFDSHAGRLPHALLLQAYMQGLDADPDCQDLVEKRTDAEHELSSEQIEAVMTALYGAGRYGIAQGGHVSADLARQPTFVVDITLTFPQVKDYCIQAFSQVAGGIIPSMLQTAGTSGRPIR